MTFHKDPRLLKFIMSVYLRSANHSKCPNVARVENNFPPPVAYRGFKKKGEGMQTQSVMLSGKVFSSL